MAEPAIVEQHLTLVPLQLHQLRCLLLQQTSCPALSESAYVPLPVRPQIVYQYRKPSLLASVVDSLEH